MITIDDIHACFLGKEIHEQSYVLCRDYGALRFSDKDPKPLSDVPVTDLQVIDTATGVRVPVYQDKDLPCGRLILVTTPSYIYLEKLFAGLYEHKVRSGIKNGARIFCHSLSEIRPNDPERIKETFWMEILRDVPGILIADPQDRPYIFIQEDDCPSGNIHYGRPDRGHATSTLFHNFKYVPPTP